MKIAFRFAVSLALLLALVHPASAQAKGPQGDPPPGPLEVKAYMPWTMASTRDPDSCVQRVYLRMRNNESGPLEVLRIEGAFLDSTGQPLFTDMPPCPTVPPGEGRELYLRFNNTGMLNHLGCRILVRYRQGGVTYERRAFVNQENPGFPDGYVPGP